MDPISTTMTIMTGLGQAIELTKNLRDADLKLNDAENKHKIAELYNALSDIKMNVADLKSEILTKDEIIKSLEAKLKIEADMTWEDPFYFLKNANGRTDGPFCQQCYDTKKQAVRLPKGDGAWLTCNACKASYDNPNVDKGRYETTSSHDPYADMV